MQIPIEVIYAAIPAWLAFISAFIYCWIKFGKEKHCSWVIGMDEWSRGFWIGFVIATIVMNVAWLLAIIPSIR